MGPIPELVGISCNYRMKMFDMFFGCFSTLHLFTFLSQNTFQKGSAKCKKNIKINEKTPTRSSFEFVPPKRNPKVWKSYPLQSFKPISKSPRYPKNITNWNPNGPRNCKLWAKWVPEKTTKNKPLKNHQLYKNGLKFGTLGATKVQQNCNFFATFSTPGPKWPRSRPGVQKRSPEASKRCQKASGR